MNTTKMNVKVTEQLLAIVNTYRQEVTEKLAGKYGFDVKEAVAFLNDTIELQTSSSSSDESDTEEKQPKEKKPPTKKAAVKKVADVTVDVEAEKAKKLAEKEADKQAKLAEKEAKTKEKAIEKHENVVENNKNNKFGKRRKRYF